MALTFDEALDTLGAKFCGACGNALDPPGSQCSGCGHLPAVTRPELAEILEAEPGSPARIEADQLRAEAADLMEQVEDKLREADQVLHADGLARARDYAQGVLEAALGERKQAAAVLEQAADAEAVTAAPVADAYQNHQAALAAEEAARRMRHGAGAETEAAMRVEKAAAVLARYKEPARAAAEARKAAEEVLAVADAKVAAAEVVRDTAAAAVASPCRAPMSRETQQALARPVVRVAAELLPVRMSRPDHLFTPADLADDRVAFALGVAGELGMLTGLFTVERAAGYRSGHDAAEVEQDARPGLRRGRSLDDATIVPPGSRRIPGGILPGTPHAVPDPGKPALALSQANPFRDVDTPYRHPSRG